MGLYSNFPSYPLPVYVFGHKKYREGKLWKTERNFLFVEHRNEFFEGGPTAFERWIKKKCQVLRKEHGYTWFSFYEKHQLRRLVKDGTWKLYKGFPIKHFKEELQELVKPKRFNINVSEGQHQMLYNILVNAEPKDATEDFDMQTYDNLVDAVNQAKEVES